MAPTEIHLITGNANKLADVRAILTPAGLAVTSQATDIPEIQGSIEEITIAKCKRAAEIIGGPVVVDDTALCFNAMNGLPGPYIKAFLEGLGPEKLHLLLSGFPDKTAQAVATLGYCLGPDHEPILFQGRINGVITKFHLVFLIMFLPPVHRETRIPILRQLIHTTTLGVLTTAISSDRHPLILSSHIPWVLDVDDEQSETELGRLRGHMARQNPQSQALITALESAGRDGHSSKTLEQEVLVLFTADHNHYVTPKFYTETKPDTAKVVPTWNYAAVQAYGTATVFYNSKSEDSTIFLSKQIDDLSQHTEASIMDYTGKGDRPGPWKVSDAPEKYIELMQKNIIGIEIVIHRLEGKYKMSQEMRNGDRQGVVRGFKSLDTDVARAMAASVQQRSDMKEAAKA
ncbi:transcriptional regulator [Paramyrothecium foliicola]|nr:transcriptional regulator [Paramyrothecium foliicola]